MGDRPSHLPPGTPLGDHYTVEGLVRLSEGRLFYLANDVRPDLTTRRCWTCGFGETSRAESACGSCGSPLKDRRFLVSSRWIAARFEAYLDFFQKALRHPGLASPIDVFVIDGVLAQGPSEAMARAHRDLAVVRDSVDGAEGRQAFKEKRKPRFTGR